ncbi:pirin family protein [Alteromonas sp. ASW11-36]|uniref:Pirin family protein n=1 Tax=Alteromonas arenosi TaxID=3055817 RepID=A0ABT7SYN1_9ALTE|nr:pirin family protein [Alteromonas sp. ASW11-36]MDM7861270.1 pirin family protein [Alteromonas sp. ASW11-36]
MISIRRAESRGRASFGWLDSRHTFSFGRYYDPAHMGVSALRVINDDKVAAGAGFGTHGHSNMEIISLVTKGAMVHKDSEGHEQLLPAGEFQLMSAGDGIMHSEFNASQQDSLQFLQIWIQPNQMGGKPGYQQKRFDLSAPVTPVITATGEAGTLQIKQDMTLSHINLDSDDSHELALQTGRTYYVHVISGDLGLDDETMHPGDGATITDATELVLQQRGNEPVKALLFDLP